jgi:hypothetical protein
MVLSYFHSVAVSHKMLTGISMDVMHPNHEVHHIVYRGLLLVMGSSTHRSQGSGNAHLNTVFAGVVPVVSSVDVL